LIISSFLTKIIFSLPSWLMVVLLFPSKCRNFVPVKKYIPIFLLSLYLISLTELSQLIKLPMLVEHYSEHKEKNKNLSVLDFLYMHYSQNNVKDADYDKDMKLPFKSPNTLLSSLEIAPVLFASENLLLKPIPSDSKQYTLYSEKHLSSAYLASIWQPPKSC
jgi:hypothetical protein